jgi:hypothetical protein
MPSSFTIEGWVYITSTSTQRFVNGSFYFDIVVATGSNMKLQFYDGGTVTADAINVIPLNTWTHVAVVRSGSGSNNCSFYVNGVRGTQFTSAVSFGSSAWQIGALSSSSQYFYGYISNLRFCNSAVYTGASFTPTTTTLTTTSQGASSCILLTCQSNRFLDNSATAATFTTGGSPSVQAFGPFAPALQWTPDVVGGSGYFDGTGDNLATGTAAALNFGTGNFTIECWYYLTGTTNGDQTIMSNAETGYNSTVKLFKLYYAGQSFPFFDLGSGNGSVAAANTSSLINQWNHAAIVRSGNTFTMYLNGVGGTPTTFAGSVNMNSNSNTYIGYFSFSDPNSRYTGYVSGLRAVTSAVYTANFTPPTTPPTAIANTQLLLNMTNAGIYDGKMGNVLETVGNAQVATSPVKYGSGSIKFNGSTDYLKGVISPNLNFGTGDFTVEFFTYVVAYPASSISLFVGGGNASGGDVNINLYVGTNGYVGATFDGTGEDAATAAGAIIPGRWQHLALVRTGNLFTIYIDGVSRATGSTSSASTLYSTSGWFVGGAATYYLNGYIDDLRVTKGVARYFTTFTPPQQALPRQ